MSQGGIRAARLIIEMMTRSVRSHGERGVLAVHAVRVFIVSHTMLSFSDQFGIPTGCCFLPDGWCLPAAVAVPTIQHAGSPLVCPPPLWHAAWVSASRTPDVSPVPSCPSALWASRSQKHIQRASGSLLYVPVFRTKHTCSPVSAY